MANRDALPYAVVTPWEGKYAPVQIASNTCELVVEALRAAELLHSFEATIDERARLVTVEWICTDNWDSLWQLFVPDAADALNEAGIDAYGFLETFDLQMPDGELVNMLEARPADWCRCSAWLRRYQLAAAPSKCEARVLAVVAMPDDTVWYFGSPTAVRELHAATAPHDPQQVWPSHDVDGQLVGFGMGDHVDGTRFVRAARDIRLEIGMHGFCW
jgi:hypothetical protein